MSELLILDPAGVAEDRVEWDITEYVGPDGADYGEAAIEAYLADQQAGSVPVDFRIPNRTVTIPLGALRDLSSASFAVVRNKLQQKAALFQKEGGWLGRDTDVGTVYADIVGATLKLGGSSAQAFSQIDPDASLVLECLPDWYEDEEEWALHSETTLPWLIWTETDVRGNFPLGNRCRLLLNEADGDNQRGALWAFRCRHYSADSTAALAYQAEALTPISPAATASLSGASGGGSNTIQHASLSRSWLGVLTTNLLAGTYLTHTGTYRVFARVYSTSGSSVQLRLIHDVGDMTLPTTNAPWTFPTADQFFLADLGEVRLDENPVGAHRWQGQIQAKGDAGGESVRIDALMFLPLDEAAGRLRAPLDLSVEPFTFTANDDFNQTSGGLNGKTAPVGGAWTTSGDADDFTIDTTNHVASRTAVSDSGPTGRWAVIGSSLTSTFVEVTFWQSALVGGGVHPALIARYANTTNYLGLFFGPDLGPQVQLIKRISDTPTTIDQWQAPEDFPNLLAASSNITARLYVDADGSWKVWLGVDGATPALVGTGRDSALATGGSLASGKGGFFDINETGGACTRRYDKFKLWTPPSDAVAFASQSLSIGTDGAFREDSSGAADGPVTHKIGDNPRLPQSGLEDRTVEVFAKLSRGDLEEIPDSGIDDVSGRLYVRRSWLYLPDELGS